MYKTLISCKIIIKEIAQIFKQKKKVKINNQKIVYYKVVKYSVKMIIKYTNLILSKNQFQNQNKTAQLQSLKISNKILKNKLIMIKIMKIT
jgi:hypothetical protein